MRDLLPADQDGANGDDSHVTSDGKDRARSSPPRRPLMSKVNAQPAYLYQERWDAGVPGDSHEWLQNLWSTVRPIWSC